MSTQFYVPSRDGITQGLIGSWMECKQKARIFLQGYSSKYTSMALTYGTIGHAVLESVYQDIQSGALSLFPLPEDIKHYITHVEKLWRKENPRADKSALEYLEHSLLLAEATLPKYFEYWSKDLKKMKWLNLEQGFKIPFETRDGRKVFIRGKMDGVFEMNKKTWLFESKFKSQIVEANLVDTLSYDLQVLLYSWALYKLTGKVPAGVLYNIVRRSGMKQGAKETVGQYIERCKKDIEKRPEYYFLRLEISLTKGDIVMFEEELNDIVTDFLNWWEGKSGHYKNTGMCIGKYGQCRYLPICSANNYNACAKREKVFNELEDM